MTTSSGSRISFHTKSLLLGVMVVFSTGVWAEYYMVRGVGSGYCNYCRVHRVVRRPCYRPKRVHRVPCYRPRPVCRTGCVRMTVRYVVPVVPVCSSCNVGGCCNEWAASYHPCRSCGVYYPPYTYRNYDPDLATGDDDVLDDPNMNNQY